MIEMTMSEISDMQDKGEIDLSQYEDEDLEEEHL